METDQAGDCAASCAGRPVRLLRGAGSDHAITRHSSTRKATARAQATMRPVRCRKRLSDAVSIQARVPRNAPSSSGGDHRHLWHAEATMRPDPGRAAQASGDYQGADQGRSATGTDRGGTRAEGSASGRSRLDQLP